MARKICQSCAMPLRHEEDLGTERNGDTTEKYCLHCYQNGEFIWKDATAEQMQVFCTGILMKKHWPGFAAKWATHGIPQLERWQKI